MDTNDAPFHRKSIRLKGFDYTSPNTYFLTICTAGRRLILGRIQDGIMQENKLGRLARSRWLELPLRFANVELDAFVVMPNHFHGMIHLKRWTSPEAHERNLASHCVTPSPQSCVLSKRRLQETPEPY